MVPKPPLDFFLCFHCSLLYRPGASPAAPRASQTGLNTSTAPLHNQIFLSASAQIPIGFLVTFSNRLIAAPVSRVGLPGGTKFMG